LVVSISLIILIGLDRKCQTLFSAIFFRHHYSIISICYRPWQNFPVFFPPCQHAENHQ